MTALLPREPDFANTLTIGWGHRQTTALADSSRFSARGLLTAARGSPEIMSDMTAMRVSYRMESTLESVNQAEEVATKIANKIGFDEEDVNRISMAVREAAVNAVLHGNAYDPAKKVTFGFENTGGALVITVADEGRGLKPDSIPDPLAPENLLKQSGRGIFLMRAFMDEVRIRSLDPGTEITMIKNVQGRQAEGKEESK